MGSDCIFPQQGTDEPMTSYNAVWDRAMKELGFTYTIYNLRDSFVTNALKRGFSSVFVARYIDSSSAMIDRKYAVAEQSIMRKVAG